MRIAAVLFASLDFALLASPRIVLIAAHRAYNPVFFAARRHKDSAVSTAPSLCALGKFASLICMFIENLSMHGILRALTIIP